ncbi:MAG: DedA family protein [Terriglobia bacterium]
MAHHLFASFSHFFQTYGYWTVFGVTLFEGAGIPLPGETLLLFAGFTARTGNIHLDWAIAAAAAGSTLGECVGYLIGHLGGKALLEGYRKRLRVSPSLYDRIEAGFLKNAGWAIFFSRFVAGLRELAGIVAGVFQMDLPSFLIYNAAGAIVWAAIMCSVGFLVGKSWRRLVHGLARIDTVIFIGFAVIVVVLILRQWRVFRKP